MPATLFRRSARMPRVAPMGRSYGSKGCRLRPSH